MNDKPAILIEFDPKTWQVVAIFFKSSTDEETAVLKTILSSYKRLAEPTGGRYAN